MYRTHYEIRITEKKKNPPLKKPLHLTHWCFPTANIIKTKTLLTSNEDHPRVLTEVCCESKLNHIYFRIKNPPATDNLEEGILTAEAVLK